jgi:hypothetical protein
LAGQVLLKIVYLLVCRMLGLAVPVFRGNRAKDAELLVVRHENAVLRRHVNRVRYEPPGCHKCARPVTCADRRLAAIGNDDHLCLCACST